MVSDKLVAKAKPQIKRSRLEIDLRHFGGKLEEDDSDLLVGFGQSSRPIRFAGIDERKRESETTTLVIVRRASAI